VPGAAISRVGKFLRRAPPRSRSGTIRTRTIAQSADTVAAASLPAAAAAPTLRVKGVIFCLLTAADVSFINIFGVYLPSEADALKDWSGTGCEVRSVSVTNAVGTMLSPSVGILTFNGGADGTCYGQKVGPIWGTSIYVKEGTAWKWTFGINLRAAELGA